MRTCYGKWWKQRLRKSQLPRWLACLVALLLNLPWTATAQPVATNATIVEVDFAKHVAAEHVNANNQPFEWRYLDHMVLYDVDGNPNGYAFVFIKRDSRFAAPSSLQQHIADVSARMLAREKDARGDASVQNDGESSGDTEADLFAFDDLATVITGATTDSPLILRHFRGAPEFWVEAARLNLPVAGKQQGKSKTASHIVMITPMDFRLLLADGGAGLASAPEARSAVKATLAGSADTLAVQSKKTERLSALRQAKEDRNARERQRLGTMKPEQRQQLERALQERAEALATGWEQKRTEWQQDNTTWEEQK